MCMRIKYENMLKRKEFSLSLSLSLPEANWKKPPTKELPNLFHPPKITACEWARSSPEK